MSEKKQIEEIRKDIFAAFGGYAKWEEDWQSLAEAVYNAGYRKQRVGVWVWKMKIEPQAQNRLYCSVCDEECLAKNNYYVKSNYCHNCGARMKGGAE